MVDYNEDEKIVLLEQRTYFKKGDVVEFFGPNITTFTYEIPDIYDVNGELLDVARHPLQLIKFTLPFKVCKNVMMRKK